MFAVTDDWSMKSVMDESSSVEESGRGCRSKRKQIDPSCCPVCSVTLRVSELDSHLVTEIDKLTKLSAKHKRCSPNSSGQTKGWETYQKVKMNRQVRLKLKSKKRKNDDIVCPVCNETTSEDITLHVEMCLQKAEKQNDNDSDDDIDVEGFEEYEWAGQTRIRASSLLEGGYTSTGIGTCVTKPNPDEEDVDVVVDGDDTHVYGPAQYTDNDLDASTADDDPEPNRTDPDDPDPPKTDSINNNSVMEALKAKIRELQSRDQNRDTFKCLICMGMYKTPVVSICCWHVHCEQCWLKTLATKKLCPQCNMITSPLDLRRVYI